MEFSGCPAAGPTVLATPLIPRRGLSAMAPRTAAVPAHHERVSGRVSDQALEPKQFSIAGGEARQK